MLLPGDRVILADAGVSLPSGAVARLKRDMPESCSISACSSDVKSRGRPAWPAELQIDLISDSAWIDQVSACRHVLSWK
jgi:hypothetical protein